MSSPVCTLAIGKLLVEALKLPPRTKNVDLRMHVNEAVSVICEYYPDRKSVETVVKHLALYEVREPDSRVAGWIERHNRDWLARWKRLREHSRFDVGHEIILPERAPERRTAP